MSYIVQTGQAPSRVKAITCHGGTKSLHHASLIAYVAAKSQCKARAIHLTQSLVIMSTTLPAKDCSRNEYRMIDMLAVTVSGICKAIYPGFLPIFHHCGR